MLQLSNIRKEYKTGTFVQKALDGVSLNLRDNEFVAILGPSGSGKTTLLNIVGGLDRYDSGDLIINGISTKKYKDRNWDSYRNHSVGFVFQSYNLIPHQSVLANVELALTIAGVGREERKRRAKEALEKVGLGAHINKKPNQLSGGQMQRVAIARALVNDPDILLADEPTGALDSATSVQVMELLKEVASDRLVVMVTHNPELAEEYATRIVSLRDGKIMDDTDPFMPGESAGAAAGVVPTKAAPADEETAAMNAPDTETPDAADAAPARGPKTYSKASMGFLTALGLSLSNLLTKKTRTILVAVAGSIGIIGIALIMSLSNGANKYIADIESETLSEYPLQIMRSSYNFSSLMMMGGAGRQAMMGADSEDGTEDAESEEGVPKTENGTVRELALVKNILSTVDTNDLGSLRDYLESDESKIYDYAKAVEYIYGITPRIYRKIEKTPAAEEKPAADAKDEDTKPAADDAAAAAAEDKDKEKEDDTVTPSTDAVGTGKWRYSQVNPNNRFQKIGLGASNNLLSSFGGGMNVFYKLPKDEELYIDQYELKAGHWPTNAGECVLVTTSSGGISDFLLYTFGLRDENKLQEMIDAFAEGKSVKVSEDSKDWSYSDFLGKKFKVVSAAEGYDYDSEKKVYIDRSGDASYMNGILDEGHDLTLVGIVRPKDSQNALMLQMGIWYDDGLIDLMRDDAEKSLVVTAQRADRKTNVLTGDPFGEEKDDLDMEGLFSIDENELRNAFQFNAGALQDLDLSGIRLSRKDLQDILETAIPDLSEEDLEKIIGDLDIDVSEEALAEMAQSLSEGYLKYAAKDPSTNYLNLQDAFSQYLASPEAQKLLSSVMVDLIGEAGAASVSPERFQQTVAAVMAGYQDYAQRNDLTDPARFQEYLAAYLNSAEGQALLQTELTKLLGEITENVDPSDVPAAEIAQKLSDGYRKYAKKHKLPDPSKFSSSLTEYLQSEEAQKLVRKGMNSAVDADKLEKELRKALDRVSGVTTPQAQKVMDAVFGKLQKQITKAFAGSMGSFGNALSVDAGAFTRAFQMNMSPEQLQTFLTSLLSNSSSSYEGNLSAFGYAADDDLSEIDIYPKNFEAKGNVTKILSTYNDKMEKAGQEEKMISYTDMVGTLMSSVTDIVNTISYILMAFVAISLLVSSIMIGVITYISVLERRKEIGVLRAMGASKHNITQVFNAETFITGLLAGLLGVGFSLFALIPGNYLIRKIAEVDNFSCYLPVTSALLLIGLSIILTLIGGLIPSHKASASDPVAALRSE